MIKAGIIGGTGYTAGELIQLLTFHPEVTIDFVYSTSKPGEAVETIHKDLIGDTDLKFSGEVNPEIDVLFLCVGHGKSKTFLVDNSIPDDVKIVDLSRDFRIAKDADYGKRNFVYGLPELNKKTITSSDSIANPGCYATAIQLALLPLAGEQLINSELHIHGITGSTGAGQTPTETTHFSWRNNNVSVYKAFNHQHLDEIKQSLQSLQPSLNNSINFLPVRGNFTRGIFITAYLDSDLTPEEAHSLYNSYYEDAPFTHVSTERVDLKQVVGSNKCILHLEKHQNKLLVTSIIDNLLKGASGQAVQNMNLMFGLDESTGLQLTSNRF